MLATVSVAVLLLVLSAAVLLKTGWAEDRARFAVEDAVNRAAPGRLAMDHLGDFEMFSPFGTFRATAKNIRVHDDDGKEVFQIGEITGELDLWALLGREIHIKRASISGAQLLCDLETGRPQLGAPSARRKAFEPRAFDLVMQNIEIVGLYAVGLRPEGQKVVLGRLEGLLDLKARGAVPGVEMNLWSFKGVLTHPQSIRLNDATGVVDTSAYTVADIKFSAIVPEASVTGRLRYMPGEKGDPLKVDIEKVRDVNPSVLKGGPLDALGGGGIDMNMFRKLSPGGFPQ